MAKNVSGLSLNAVVPSTSQSPNSSVPTCLAFYMNQRDTEFKKHRSFLDSPPNQQYGQYRHPKDLKHNCIRGKVRLAIDPLRGHDPYSNPCFRVRFYRI